MRSAPLVQKNLAHFRRASLSGLVTVAVRVDAVAKIAMYVVEGEPSLFKLSVVFHSEF